MAEDSKDKLILEVTIKSSSGVLLLYVVRDALQCHDWTFPNGFIVEEDEWLHVLKGWQFIPLVEHINPESRQDGTT